MGVDMLTPNTSRIEEEPKTLIAYWESAVLLKWSWDMKLQLPNIESSQYSPQQKAVCTHSHSWGRGGASLNH